MFLSTLKATTVEGENYLFSIRDVPVWIDNNRVALFHKPNSPLLLGNTIRACTDDNSLWEGSRIQTEDSDIYTISYKRGFAAMNFQRKVLKLSELPPYIIVKDNEELSPIHRQKLLFSYNDIRFQLRDLVGIVDGQVVVREGHTQLDISKVKQ